MNATDDRIDRWTQLGIDRGMSHDRARASAEAAAHAQDQIRDSRGPLTFTTGGEIIEDVDGLPLAVAPVISHRV